MSRGAFGWDLPPGCSMRDIEAQMGRDPTPLEEDVLSQLEKHEVPTMVCDRIMQILDAYQIEDAEVKQRYSIAREGDWFVVLDTRLPHLFVGEDGRIGPYMTRAQAEAAVEEFKQEDQRARK